MKNMLFILVFTSLIGCAAGNIPDFSTTPVQREDWSSSMCRMFSGWGVRPAEILFLGDSITQGWTRSSSHKYSGGKEVFERYFGKYSTLNFGIDGDKTENIIWRISEGKQLDGAQRKIIVLLVGVNNINRKEHEDTAEEVVAGIRKILDIMREKQPQAKILLCSILPWGTKRISDTARWDKSIKINELSKSLADGKDIIYIDFLDKYLTEDKLHCRKGFSRDGVHPSPLGYEIMASILEPEIAKIIQGSSNESADVKEMGSGGNNKTAEEIIR